MILTHMYRKVKETNLVLQAPTLPLHRRDMDLRARARRQLAGIPQSHLSQPCAWRYIYHGCPGPRRRPAVPVQRFHLLLWTTLRIYM